MVDFSIVCHLLSDTESLSNYENGLIVDFADVKRRLFLLRRQMNNFLPDQYYRLALEKDMANLDSLQALIGDGIHGIAKKYLELEGARINIKANKQNEWQEVITYVPPLLLQMSFLQKSVIIANLDIANIQAYFNNHILPNTKYTALPSASIPELKNLLQTQNGFQDLHIHLNGATELDIVWQDFLSFPDRILEEFEKGNKLHFVREQLEQESNLLTPMNFYKLLKIARRIRNMLYEEVFSIKSPTKNISFKELLKSIVCEDRYSREKPDAFHPFSMLIDNYDELPNNMPVEGLMYVLIFKSITESQNKTVASLFHFYLLIQGLANRLLVQQVHQKGFQQFQKITLNGLRELIEEKYAGRFFQMHGNDLNFLNFLEGKFSPKKSGGENAILIDSIEAGWHEFNRKICEENQFNNFAPILKLVAHFIKRPDIEPDPFYRHLQLREDTWERAVNLSLLIKGTTKYSKIISGFDAAASEFDTPPEVFAPSYRFLRRELRKLNVSQQFTYHVGEDFFHLIGGIRAIYEAVEFLELKPNDRIGHGTAIGISAKDWKDVVGETLLVRKGEWLDNLIFMHYIARQSKVFSAKILKLEFEISLLANFIYGENESWSVSEHTDAWLFRRYCPMLVCAASIHDASKKSTFDLDEWSNIEKNITETVKNLICLYHREDIRERYNKIKRIACEEIFDVDDLALMQKLILKRIAEKEIVIETLPTSNVRIGNYRNYGGYHLNNWIEMKKSGNSIPHIVLGTDDTGIFATNIYNEYANIWDYLTNAKGLTSNETLSIINELNDNSITYRFE